LTGNAKELEKNMVYAQPEWDSPRYRIKKIKKGKEGVVITHQNDETVELGNMHAVRFFPVGEERD